MKPLSNSISWWRVQYTESDAMAVADAIRSERLSLGPLTFEFEQAISEKLSVPYVVATTSGSMALLMALIAMGVGVGDEVIVPNRTWIAAAHAVMMVGAKVKLVDVCETIPILDITQLENKITSKTKAIIPASLSGRAVNIDEINKVAKKYNIFVIEDAAQAFLSRDGNAYSGVGALISCFSLSMAKLISTGQGGFLATKNEEIYKALLKIRTHGVNDLLNCSFDRFGFNFRFTDLQASLGKMQLKKVDQKIKSINAIYQRYEAGLKDFSNIKLIPVAVSKGEIPLYIEVVCKERERLMSFLTKKKIQTKAFYPNLNRAVYMEDLTEFKNANKFESQGIILPCGPDQTLENVDRVIEAISLYEAKKN